MILNILFIILVGVLTTYTDLKRRIIQNKVVLAAFLAAPFLHIFNIIQNPSLISAVPYMVYNIAFSVFAGVLLWFIYVWPAGDAKLFIAYSSLLPLDIYRATGSFMSFDFLMNTFVPVFFVMLLVLLRKSKKPDIKKGIKVALDPYTIFITGLVITGFLWFFLGIFSLLGIPHDYLIIMVFLFVMIEIVNKISPFNLEYTYIIVAVIRILVDYRSVFTFGFAYYLLSILLVFMVFRSFVLELSFSKNTVRRKIGDLKPGMQLAEGISEKGHGKKAGYEKVEFKQFTFIGDLKERTQKKFIHNMSFGGLTEDDVKKIKRLRKDGKIPFDDILVHIVMPFALFLFLGVLLTVFLRTNFVTYIIHFLASKPF